MTISKELLEKVFIPKATPLPAKDGPFIDGWVFYLTSQEWADALAGAGINYKDFMEGLVKMFVGEAFPSPEEVGLEKEK